MTIRTQTHTHVDQLDQEPGRRHDEDLQQAITEPLHTDGSPEGWMQRVLFRLKAGNTLLRWHAALALDVTPTVDLSDPHTARTRCGWKGRCSRWRMTVG